MIEKCFCPCSWFVSRFNDKPIFDQWEKQIDAQENQSINITLSAHGFPPDIEYKCFDSLNESIKTFSHRRGEFLLENLQRNQSGTYRCHARNFIGQANIEFQVNVQRSFNLRRKLFISVSKFDGLI